MALSETKINQLEKKFDEMFSEGEGSIIGRRFMSEDEATSEDIIDQALRTEKFPMDANMYNVKSEIYIHKGRSEQDWAEHFIEEQNVNEENFQAKVNDEELYYFITENLDKTNIQVEIKENLAEWLDKHGTVEYLEKKMEDEYEAIILQEFIETEDSVEVRQKAEQTLKEEGFPEHVTVNMVDYSVYDVKLTETFESLAERHIDDIERYGGVSKYIKNQFYKDIAKDNVYTFNVEILSDREDFE